MAGVEVGLINGSFVINPPKSNASVSELSLILAGTAQDILMIEGAANFLSEEQLLAAIEFGHEAIRQICAAIESFANQVGKPKKTALLHRLPPGLVHEMDAAYGPALLKALATPDKQRRGIAVSAVEAQIEQHFTSSPVRSNASLIRTDVERLEGDAVVFGDEDPVSELDAEDTATAADDSDDDESSGDIHSASGTTSDEDEASEIIHPHPQNRRSAQPKLPMSPPYDAMDVKVAIKKLMTKKLRAMVQLTGRRADGRRVDEVRPLSMETSWLPGAHGSALFTRYAARTDC